MLASNPTQEEVIDQMVDTIEKLANALTLLQQKVKIMETVMVYQHTVIQRHELIVKEHLL